MAKTGFYGEDVHINLLRGCVDDGACPIWDSCWARNMARRLAGRGYPSKEPFAPHIASIVVHTKADYTLGKKPKVVALNYMGEVALQPSNRVTGMAAWCSERMKHTFLWLTKRPAMLREKLGDVRLSENVWLGCSAWDQASADRNIPALLAVPAAHYWVSLEPLWGPVNIEAHFWRTGPIGADGRRPTRIQWVVVGCESGPKRRLFPDHSIGPIPVSELSRGAVGQCEDAFLYAVRSLRDQCAAAQVPFYCKHLPLNGAVVSNVAAFPEDLATMKVRRRPWRAE